MCSVCGVLFFFKQKTAYEMRISDWSSDVCSSDLSEEGLQQISPGPLRAGQDGGAWPGSTTVIPTTTMWTPSWSASSPLCGTTVDGSRQVAAPSSALSCPPTTTTCPPRTSPRPPRPTTLPGPPPPSTTPPSPPPPAGS